MTYRAQVRNGQIQLEGGASLPDGTIVDVTPVEAPTSHAAGPAPRGSARAILASRARWDGPADEADQLLAELRREKWAEVEAQQAAAEHDL